MTKKPKNFETVVKEVDELVQRLENADTGLEDALSTYEKGVAAIALAQKQLANAEQRVQQLASWESNEDDSAES